MAMNDQTKNIESKVDIINAIKTPLGFFVLIILIVEVVFGTVSVLSQGTDRTFLIIGMIILISLLIVIVAFMAIFKPKSLYGIQLEKQIESENYLDELLKQNVRLPKIPKASLYTPNDEKEHRRLKVQGDLSSPIDVAAFKKALSWLDGKKDLSALDIGCADGYVTFDRFEKFNEFKKIIGIDKDENQIKDARKEAEKYGNRYIFHSIDVAKDDFQADMALFNREDKHQYDFAFIALTLHHLAYPQKLIKDIYNLLDDKGVLVIRDVDDGTKIYYPDENRIIANLMKVSTDSPHTADRWSARKLYSRLKNAGFTKIDIQYYPLDTLNRSREEREQIFVDSFSFRGSHVKRLISQGRHELESHYKWICDAQRFIEDQFVNNDQFYYLELRFIAIAQK